MFNSSKNFELKNEHGAALLGHFGAYVGYVLDHFFVIMKQGSCTINVLFQWYYPSQHQLQYYEFLDIILKLNVGLLSFKTHLIPLRI